MKRKLPQAVPTSAVLTLWCQSQCANVAQHVQWVVLSHHCRDSSISGP